MKKIILIILLISPYLLHAQVGIKAGLNFANITNAANINSSSSSGFSVSFFLAPASKGILSYATEIGFSKQGYNYGTNVNTGKVNLSYIMMPHLMAINITRYFQLQVGLQTAILINAKADSSNTVSSSPYDSITKSFTNALSRFNRFDYGAAAGFEIHPVNGFIIGIRYNLSLGDLFKSVDFTQGQPVSYIPKVDAKKNLVQLYVGWHFANRGAKKKG